MKNKNIFITIRRIRAFTLTEFVVATLISAILIGLVVSAFSFLIGHMRNETGLMDEIENTFILESCLANNAIKCDSINVNENHLNFYWDGVSDYLVEFSDNYIVLYSHEFTDTFNLNCSDFLYSFYDAGTGLVSKVNFKINIGSLSIPMTISKEYEGLILVNSIAIEHEN